jgi:SAM-dependent methyltransferase
MGRRPEVACIRRRERGSALVGGAGTLVKEEDLMTAVTTEAFRSIYRNNTWAMGQSKSGPGSDPGPTRSYRRFLKRFLRQREVRSVVDLGCGDWTSTRLIDWSDIDYLGLDVVPEVIQGNCRQYGRPGVRFDVADLAGEDELPPADLAICKEVLQHLPNADVLRVLGKLGSFKMALLVNDRQGSYECTWRNLWRGRPFDGTNGDVEPGGYRPLQLLEDPFNLNAEVVLRYRCGFNEDRWDKEVLLWTNPAQLH